MGKLVVSSFSAAVPKRLHKLATAISDQWDGPAALETGFSRLFCLSQRIFSGFSIVTFAFASPSGSGPDGGNGDYSYRSFFIGDKLGPNRVYVILFRVLGDNKCWTVLYFLFALRSLI